MGADVDIDADHLALADEFQDRRHEQHRAAAGYSRFYDEVGLGCPDDFLGGNYVGRELYDGHTHPAPEVGIVISIRGMQRVHRGLERSAVAAERQGLDTLLFFECGAVVEIGHTRIALKSALIYPERSNPRLTRVFHPHVQANTALATLGRVLEIARHPVDLYPAGAGPAAASINWHVAAASKYHPGVHRQPGRRRHFERKWRASADDCIDPPSG